MPGIFETSLALVSHVLLFLRVPPADVLETTEQIRHERYAILRNVFRRRENRAPLDPEDDRQDRQQLYTVVLPPGARGVGQTIRDLGLERGRVTVNAIRREGITGRDPDPETRLKIGDVLVLWGRPEDVQQAESRLLMG